MTTHIEATFANGVLKPDQPLPFADQTRVRLTVEPIEGWSRASAMEALEAIKTEIQREPLHLGRAHYTRDELHERR
jgi:predicted DNA-binding antitoxin AbrB/MazE fold protein